MAVAAPDAPCAPETVLTFPYVAFVPVGLLAGAVFASGAACLAGRWATSPRVSWRGRSRCDRCGCRLRPRALVPVLGALARCPGCGARAPGFLPLIEGAAAAAGGALVLDAPGLLAGIATSVVILGLVLAGEWDRRAGEVPVPLSVALLVAAGFAARPPFDLALASAAGAGVAFAFGCLVARLRTLPLPGGADLMVIAALAAWMGPPGLAAAAAGLLAFVVRRWWRGVSAGPAVPALAVTGLLGYALVVLLAR